MMSNHFITLSQAAGMTSQYRGGKENILASTYKNSGTLPICETFARADFDALLAQTGCVSVRAYFGMDENLKVSLIFVGVDSNGADMVVNPGLGMDTNIILDDGIRCPTVCPPSSPLNEV